jgi:lysozyme
MGERMKYTSERIYGIDISRHQHEKGRKRFDIDWSKLRITSLGARHNAGGQTFPVSFVYIKSTEGTTIRNRYFMSDYMKAKQHGIHVGAYHFFSLKSSAQAQAIYFVNHTLFRKGDFPPVLDVEPTDAQIKKIGGDDVLMQRIRTFMEIVEKRTGMRPILYISQNFINNHMNNAADIKQKYNVWIARYGQYRPDVRLLYWQLCPDGKVSGITGDVDINVFNGYKKQFEEFEKTGYYK